MSKDARKDKILSKNPIKQKKKKWHEKNFLGNTKKEINQKGSCCMEKVVNHLNILLADLNVFYRKLQSYHWNIKGHEFFWVHEKL